jgi:hypothetical protein
MEPPPPLDDGGALICGRDGGALRSCRGGGALICGRLSGIRPKPPRSSERGAGALICGLLSGIRPKLPRSSERGAERSRTIGGLMRTGAASRRS